MNPELMERVWNAYWAEDDNTEKSLERVVAVVLEHAALVEAALSKALGNGDAS